MKWLAVAAVLLVLGIRLVLVAVGDTELRDDVLMDPSLSTHVGALDAERINDVIDRAVHRHNCELVPGSVKVDVGPTHVGSLNVQGAGLSVHGGNTGVQDVDIAFSCKRPSTFWVRTTTALHFHFTGLGSGSANHWPREPGEQPPYDLDIPQRK
jgi:hypothetical protein